MGFVLLLSYYVFANDNNCICITNNENLSEFFATLLHEIIEKVLNMK